MIPVILQVHVDRGQWVDVPVTPDTTCRDVIECCREPGDEPCRLIQTMGFKEEPIPLDFRMMDVLARYGENWPVLSFHLQYGDPHHVLYSSSRPRQFSPTNMMRKKDVHTHRRLPEGGDISLSELRQMAARQQHQIEAHQQLLVAKEQRLKFLKQQDVRHQQQQGVAVDADRLRHLREKVELQELKLRRLRALRGQVEQHRSNNTNLSAELESIRALFNEKEKELSVAVAKVEELTRQLEDVRRGDMKGVRQGNTPSPAALEFQKLRRELMYRSKLNEQQNARIAQQRETLAKRQSEISQMDQRIAELQQRLQRKRLLNQQLSSQLHAASRARPRANIAAVEPLKRAAQDIELIQDDLKVSGEQQGEFTPNKKDPKYQTLPYNTKFSGVNNHDSRKSSPTVVNGDLDKHVLPGSGPPPYPESSNRYQPHHKPSPPQGLGNLSPRPFGTTYSTSLLSSDPVKRGQHHSQHRYPVSTSSSSNINSSSSLSVANSKPVTSTAITSSGPHRSKALAGSYSSHQTVLPPTVMTSQSNVNRTVPQTPIRQHPSPGFGSLHQRAHEAVQKPAVPPKPGNSSKPVPPPRQIHGVSSLLSNLPKPDTVDQALSVLKGSNRGLDEYRTNSKFPSSSRVTQERVHPPYHHIQQKSDVHSEANKENNSQNNSNSESDGTVPQNHVVKSSPVRVTEASTVHISLNRRIGMPPAFYFPENQTPPSDLSSSETSDRLLSKRSTEDHFSNKSSHETVQPASSDLNSVQSVENSKESSDDFTASSSSDPPSDSGILMGSSSSSCSATDCNDRTLSSDQDSSSEKPVGAVLRRVKKGNLKTKGAVKSFRRVSFDPLALLLDAALEGELELVKKTAKEVPNPSAANDEGITALHNAICAGHFEIVKFLVEYCCDVNAQDSDGWTPLHCAASCNNLGMVKYLVERGACIFATTLSDHETAAEKCEEDEEGFDGCSEYLYSMQEKLGILNGGTVYALYDYESQNSDELSFRDGDQIVVLRKGDDLEREWWWSKLNDREGYVPRNLLGLYPRVTTKREQ